MALPLTAWKKEQAPTAGDRYLELFVPHELKLKWLRQIAEAFKFVLLCLVFSPMQVLGSIKQFDRSSMRVNFIFFFCLVSCAAHAAMSGICTQDHRQLSTFP